MDHSSPPLFKQGPSALLRLIVFVALAIALLVIDARYKTLGVVRQTIGTALQPLQRAALVPRDLALSLADHFASNLALQAENKQLRARNLELGLAASRAVQLDEENRHLRGLLQLQQRAPMGVIPADVLYDARDPFTRTVMVSRGAVAGVQAGAPVVNETGLIGQVTRVYPLQSEVSLLTDKNLAVPVQNVRTGVRSVVYGLSSGDLLDLRFVPVSVDIKLGDELVTSGLDGIYPSGLPVARVVQIDKQSDTAFAHVLARPIAPVEGVRQLLVLKYDGRLPPMPDASDAVDPAPEAAKAAKGGKKAAAANASKAAVSKPPSKTEPKPAARAPAGNAR